MRGHGHVRGFAAGKALRAAGAINAADHQRLQAQAAVHPGVGADANDYGLVHNFLLRRWVYAKLSGIDNK